MTKSQMLVWLRDTICEAREQGVRGTWDEGGDEYLFREHIESLEKRKRQIILGLNKYAQKLSEPILQEMTTKGEGAPGSALTGNQNRCHVRQADNGERGLQKLASYALRVPRMQERSP